VEGAAAVSDDDIAAAWDAVHDAICAPPGWEAVRPGYHGEERLWAAYAHDARHVPRPRAASLRGVARDDRGGGAARAGGRAAGVGDLDGEIE
jgi:hypothetical protein